MMKFKFTYGAFLFGAAAALVFPQAGAPAEKPSFCPPGTALIRLKTGPTQVREVCVDVYEYPNIKNDFPKTGVTWFEAGVLCKKQGKRLCSDKEWEEACLGCLPKLPYSYGSAYEEGKCLVTGKEPGRLGALEGCASSYSIYDLVGNVREWTSGLGVGTLGGSYKSGAGASCADWKSQSLKRGYKDVGFRCCQTLNEQKTIRAGEEYCPSLDTDHDGIPDKTDKCPLIAEDHDGFEDADGCPDLDNDKDGIPDSVDRCLLDAEDMDGFQDADGCPELDNDQDGIPDLEDKCPLEKEDKDGFEDVDGCPDFDNDKDGLADSTDKCPNAAENKNGFQDEDGCPDEPPKKIEGRMILRGINFKTNSTEILPESFVKLDEVVLSLKTYPEVNIEIRGYTDNIGDDAFNLKLSDGRANSVRTYLLDHGIEAYRMVAKGFGKKNPIASNKTAEGRAENRRIEFYRIK